ncbi:MAG: aminotransferase class IV [bacterium]
MLAREGAVLDFEAHLERMAASARDLRLFDPLKIEPLAEAVQQALAKSGMRDARLSVLDERTVDPCGHVPDAPASSVAADPRATPTTSARPLRIEIESETDAPFGARTSTDWIHGSSPRASAGPRTE